MAAEPKRTMTREEYLAFERASEVKHEFVDGEVYAMAGASERHNLIFGGVFGSLLNQLRGRGCRVYPSDMRVKMEALGLYAYPDLSIVCGPSQFEKDGRDTLLNPAVLIEILSPSTEIYDRTRKFRRYRTIPSFQEYVLIAQDEPTIEHYARQADGQWLYALVEGLEATLTLPTVGCALALAEVYEQVAFEPGDTR